MATTLTATLSLDMTTAQTQWTTTKQAISQLPALAQAVQATLGQISVTGAPGAPGTMTYTVSDAQTTVAVGNLLAAAQSVVDDIKQFQADLDALVPTVTNVA